MKSHSNRRFIRSYFPGIVNRTLSSWISIERYRIESMDWVRQSNEIELTKIIELNRTLDFRTHEFAKLLLKINNKFFEARLASLEQVHFIFLRPHNMIFVQVISSTESNRTQSNGFDMFDLVRLELVRFNTDLHSID